MTPLNVVSRGVTLCQALLLGSNSALALAVELAHLNFGSYGDRAPKLSIRIDQPIGATGHIVPHTLNRVRDDGDQSARKHSTFGIALTERASIELA